MDSVSDKNYIWLLSESRGSFTLQKIASLNVSVIYSTKILTGYVFSTIA